MALTDLKRRFVAALQSGLSGAKAAVRAGYSEKGAAQAASRLMKDRDVQAALARGAEVNKAKQEAKAAGRELDLPTLAGFYSDPLEFLRAVVNDGEQDMKLRTDAAKAWAPYVHPRKDAAGKKAAANEKAKETAGTGRFTQFGPPSAPTKH